MGVFSSKKKKDASGSGATGTAPEPAEQDRRKDEKPAIIERVYINPNAPEKGVACVSFSLPGGKGTVQLECKDRVLKLPTFKSDGRKKEFTDYIQTIGFVERIIGAPDDAVPKDAVAPVMVYTLQHPDLLNDSTFPEHEYISDVKDEKGVPRRVRVRNGVAKTTYLSVAEEMRFKGYILIRQTEYKD